MIIRDSKQKHYERACYATRDFVGKKFCIKRSDQVTLPQIEHVEAPCC